MACLHLSAQEIVSGRLIDSLTGAPIPFVTVYFDGTTVGTNTDEEGNYDLPLRDISLPAVLVATHLSYRTVSRIVKSDGQQAEFSLAPVANEIAAVEVGDRDNRKKNVAEFRDYFLGTDDWGLGASLFNEDRLLFDRTYRTDTMRNADAIVARHGLPDDLREVKWSLDGKTLTFELAEDLRAKSVGPIRVDAPDLGYHVMVNLISFAVNYQKGTTTGLGTYYFEPYEAAAKKPATRHARNRRETYYFSSQHFLRALFTGSLDEEGFATYEMMDDNTRPIALNEHLVKVSPTEMALHGLEDRRIAVLYYHDRRGRPLPPDRRKRAAYATSYFTVHEDGASFRSDGTLGNSPISFGGVMGTIQITRMLPSDYRPDRD